MPLTKQQLFDEARALPPAERAQLIEDLRQITDHDELTPALRAELRRRVAAIDRGEVSFVPGEQVMREIRDSVNRR